MLSLILVENPPTKYYLTVKAMNGILDRASRRGKPLPDLLTTAIAGMKEWYRQNSPGGGNPAYTLKIRQGCDGGGKGALIQTELSATLATNNDQTLFQVCPNSCIPINTMLATRCKALGKGTGIGIGTPGDPQFTITTNHEHAVAYKVES